MLESAGSIVARVERISRLVEQAASRAAGPKSSRSAPASRRPQRGSGAGRRTARSEADLLARARPGGRGGRRDHDRALRRAGRRTRWRPRPSRAKRRGGLLDLVAAGLRVASPRRAGGPCRRKRRIRSRGGSGREAPNTPLDSPAMEGRQIRERFLRFFEERGHRRVPSSSLIPPPESGLLLTNAGMNQFIPYFLGHAPAPFPRATSRPEVLPGHRHRQRRAYRPAPHVVRDARELLLRRLLQAESCAWACELVTEGYGIDPDRIWVTVYETDDEAVRDLARHRDPGRADRPPGRREDNYW